MKHPTGTLVDKTSKTDLNEPIWAADRGWTLDFGWTWTLDFGWTWTSGYGLWHFTGFG